MVCHNKSLYLTHVSLVQLVVEFYSMQSFRDSGFYHLVALSSRIFSLNLLSQSYITSTHISLVRTSHMSHLEAKGAWKSNQPRKKIRTPVLEYSWSLPWCLSLSVQWLQFSTMNFLIKDALDTHWSSVGRICPVTSDPKTSNKQECLIPWESLSTDQVLHLVPWPLCPEERTQPSSCQPPQ